MHTSSHPPSSASFAASPVECFVSAVNDQEVKPVLKPVVDPRGPYLDSLELVLEQCSGFCQESVPKNVEGAALDLWRLEVGLRKLRGVLERGYDVPLSIKVSAESLLSRRLDVMVHDALIRHMVEPAYLILELADLSSEKDVPFVRHNLERLRDRGVKLSLHYQPDSAEAGCYLDLASYACLGPEITACLDKKTTKDQLKSKISDLCRTGTRIIVSDVTLMRQVVQLRDMGCDLARGGVIEKLTPIPWTSQ